MPFKFALGRKPGKHDPSVPHFGAIASKLPAPPPSADWHSRVPKWGMLGNDSVGDCVEAATLHALLQFSTYAGAPVMPTDKDALTFYEHATGYTPSNPDSDQGSYLIGPGGTMHFWITKGVPCGGKLNKCSSYMQMTGANTTHWMQAVSLFGGILTGIQLPQAIVSGDEPPAVWSDYSGDIAGGHEIWVNGYSGTPGNRLYDLISWGQHYQCTEDFLKSVIQDAVVVTDGAAINPQGLDAAGLTLAQLNADLKALHSA